MNESSQTWLEKAREMETKVFQALRTDEKRQADIVRGTGLDKSTVSRLINHHGPGLLKILAYLGHDFASPNTVQVPKADFAALTRFAVRHLESAASPDKGAD